jgi:uncharacterized protein YkwD
MNRHLSRLLPLGILPLTLIAGLLLTAAPAVTATTTTTITTLPAAETQMIGLLNAQRSALGLVPLQLDTRLTAIARARSADMAAKNYFAHQQPDGLWAWDLMNQAGIKWYAVGEIIGRTGGIVLADSGTTVAAEWKASSAHYALITSSAYNYLGVGLAVDATGRYIWSVEFIKGPDRSGPSSYFTTSANVSSTATSTSTSSVKHYVTIRWSGADVRLQTLTSGILDYRVQYRLAGTYTWYTLVYPTSLTYASRYLYAGRIYELRVMARDRAGNYGPWSATLRLMP